LCQLVLVLAAEPHSKLDVNAEKEIHIFILTSQLCRATGRVLKTNFV